MNTGLGLAEPVTNYEVSPNFLVSLEKKPEGQEQYLEDLL